MNRKEDHVLMRIHDLDDQAEAILKTSVELSRDATVLMDRLDQASQLFVSRRMAILPNGELMLFSFGPERVAEAPGDFAIEQLKDFSTIYDGIMALWDAVREKPAFDLESRFVRWPLVQKSFLVSGFRDTANIEKATWAEARIARLEELIQLPHFDPERDAEKLKERLERIKAGIGRTGTSRLRS
jgi:hypothetical protein